MDDHESGVEIKFTFKIIEVITNCSENPHHPLTTVASTWPTSFANHSDLEGTNKDEAEMRFSMVYLHFIFTLVLAPVNILANSFSCHIFRQPMWKRSCTSLILIGLSLFEILFHLCVLSDSLIRRFAPQTFSSVWSVAFLLTCVRVINYLQFTFQITRNWTVVLLAAHRYEAICRSLSHVKLFYERRIYPILFTVFIIMCSLGAPRFFDSIVTICDASESSGVVKYEIRDVNEAWYNYGYLSGLMFGIQSGGPVIVVLILSIFVIRMIWRRRTLHKIRHSRNRNPCETTSFNAGRPTESKKSTSSSTNSRSIKKSAPSSDKLVLVLSLTFFLLETPSFFSKMLHPILAVKYQTADYMLTAVANLLIYLDSTVNILIYMLSNPTYRLISINQLAKCGIHLRWPLANRRSSYEETAGVSTHPLVKGAQEELLI